MTDLKEKLRVATLARETMDYPWAIRLYREIIQDEAADEPLRRQALHMRGVCERCVHQFDVALKDFDDALNLCVNEEQRAHVIRDKARVFIERWQDAFDESRAFELLEEALNSFHFALSVLSKIGPTPERQRLLAETAATRSFMGCAYLRRGDIKKALREFMVARKVLKGLQKHYLINNDVSLVRALSQHRNPLRRHVQSRVYALIGVFESIFARHDGRRAGSNTRVKEFGALLLGGEKLYEREKQRFLKQFK